MAPLDPPSDSFDHDNEDFSITATSDDITEVAPSFPGSDEDLTSNFNDAHMTSDDVGSEDYTSVSLQLGAPRELNMNIPQFDSYQQPHQDANSFEWNTPLLMHNEHALLPPVNMHSQQAPLFYDNSFAPIPSMSGQPTFAHMQSQPTLGQAQAFPTYGMTSLMGPDAANLMLTQGGTLSAVSTGSNFRDGQTRSAQESLIVPSPFLPANFSSNNKAPSAFEHPSPPAKKVNSSVAAASATMSLQDSPTLPMLPPPVSSNKENVSPTPQQEQQTDVSKGARKKILPRPKARQSTAKKTGDASWCQAACNDLRRLLKGPDACEAVHRWKSLEESLGYPGMTKVSTMQHILFKFINSLTDVIETFRMPFPDQCTRLPQGIYSGWAFRRF